MNVLKKLIGVLLVLLTTAEGCDFATARRLQETGNDTDTNTTTLSPVEEDDWVEISDPDLDDTDEIPVHTTTDCEVDPSSPVQGLAAELRMMARQTRGKLHIRSNCQFEVERLEVALEESDNENENQTIALDWYAADSLEVQDVANRTLLAKGGLFSATDLTGDAVHVFATEYDLSTVGAILLVDITNQNEQQDGNNDTIIVAQALIQKLQPGPAADLLAPQPTYFENCLTLSDTARVRWTVTADDSLEVGLEYITPLNDPANTWIGFGPAAPGIEDRIMGGSDVVIAGFRELGSEDGTDEEEETITPFAQDYYIGGYQVCTEIDPVNQTYDGVCPDSVWTDDDSSNNAELMYSQVLEGVSFVRFKRPLIATTPQYDNHVTPGTAQHFVWAKGPLVPDAGIAEVEFHGYQYGQLKYIDVNETTWSCPPLKGIELFGTATSGIADLDSSDDAFTQKFEHRTVLQGDLVEVYWTLKPETSQIHIGARAIVGSSKWMSIAIGSSMTDAWAWVATTDSDDPELLSYRMSGLDATTVRLVSDEDEMGMLAENPLVSLGGGHLSFEVTANWPLPGMKKEETSAPIIWAVGPSWRGPSAESPKRQDEHSIRSKAPTTVDFATGGAQIGSAPQNTILLIHGALMFVAWLVAAPLTGIASRYIRNDPCVPEGSASWIDMHKYGAASVFLLGIVGLILAVVAVADAGLQHFVSAHSRVGMALLCLIFVQNFLGMQRPSPSDVPGFTVRRVWEISHRVFAITMVALAIASVITGSQRLENFDSRARWGVSLSIIWVLVLVLLLGVYEYRRMQIHAPVHASTPDQSSQEKSDEEQDGEEPSAPKSTPETPAKSKWILNSHLVYGIPFLLGVFILSALAIVAFTGSTSYEGQVMQASAATASAADGSTDAPATVESDSTETITNAPVAYVPSTVEVSESCTAFPADYVGDGWCDDQEPFNTAACGFDGGDCCNVNLGLYNCKDPSSSNFGKTSPLGWASPITIPRNPRYSVSREETEESWVIAYNNYYEFGFTKDIVEEANKHADFLAAPRWYIDISGLVENPMTIDVASLVDQMQLEERMYRHRCVEAWSITAPWVGFPLSKILDMVQPKEDAAIVQFVSWKNTTASNAQSTRTNYPWPYTEALTIEEARNELTMLTVGAFGKPLTPQSGAPIRLNVPWKYGFKSIKSIEKITFLEDDEESRNTFWSVINGREYGFYANVNPEVPHRRWSQGTERHYVTGFPGTRLDSTRMNGYQSYVDYMYEEDLENREIYF